MRTTGVYGANAAPARLLAASLRRRHRRATVSAALLVGIAAGLAMGVWGWSRLAGGALDRWLEVTQPETMTLDGCPPEIDPATGRCFSPEISRALYEAVDTDPTVGGVGYTEVLPVGLSANQRHVDATAASVIAEAGMINVPVVVAGRLPAAGASDELMLASGLADALAVGVGDEVEVEVCGWGFSEDPCTRNGKLLVVGIESTLGDIAPGRRPAPGLDVRHPDRSARVGTATWRVLAADHFPYAQTDARAAADTDRDGVADALARALPDWATSTSPAETFDIQQAMADSVGSQSAGLALLAGVVAIAATMFGLLVVSRQLRRELAGASSLRALGAQPALPALAAVLRIAPLVGLAAPTAVVTQIIVARIGPGGPAEALAAAGDQRVDLLVAAVGITVTAAVVAAAAVLGATSVRRPTTRRSGRLAGRAARVSPVVRAAWSLTGDGRRQYVWPATLAVFLAAVGVVGAAGLQRSFDRAIRSPAAYGAWWDYGVASTQSGSITTDEDADTLGQSAIDEPIVTEAALIGTSAVELDSGYTLDLLTFVSLKGEPEPVIVAGRMPIAADEIALAPRTMDDLGVAVGDRLEATTARTFDFAIGARYEIEFGPFEVVGSVLTNDDQLRIGPGDGAYVVPGLFEPAEGLLVVRTDHERAPADEVALLAERFGPYVTVPSAQHDLGDLELVRGVPAAIAASLAVLAAAAFVHALINCAQLGRRQLATLRALGFRRRDAVSSVIVLGWSIVVPATVIGGAVGVIAAQWGWSLIAGRIGMVIRTSVPITPLIVLIGAVVLATPLLVWQPSWSVSRRRLADDLRRE